MFALEAGNRRQDVSKKQETPSEHSGGKWSLLSEHLAGFRQQKNEHFA